MKRRAPASGRSLEARVNRLEAQLGHGTHVPARAPALSLHPAVTLTLGLAVLGCGYLGLGLPQHPYQPLFAALVVAVAYHRGLWALQLGHWRWPQVAINFLVLTMFFKLLIGGGTRHPLDWLRVPSLKKVPAQRETPWYDQLIPEFDIEWLGVPAVTDLSLDITMIQTFLLLATLAGAVFRFQPFASLTAVLLLIVSIPTFVSFNWEWVVLFLVLGGVSFYLQTVSPPSSQELS
ncbi:MAG: hypothetical protein ACE5K1_03035 [Acidiferrobacterales bacterium]